MSVNTKVVDRVPTYPGRVKLTPVSGQTNTYDLVRADSPTQEGTPINKALLDQKAYTLTSDVTVYVSTAGNDTTGNGTAAKPYRTIQKAIDDIPKNLGGYWATIDIANGTYAERIAINGFGNGRLFVGVADRTVTVRGISVHNSRHVHLNISNLTWPGGETLDLFYVGYGSNVSLGGPITVDGGQVTVSGIGVADGSILTGTAVAVTVKNMGGTAIMSTNAAQISFGNIYGENNKGIGLRAYRGGIITYYTLQMASVEGVVTSVGGRVLTGSGTALANASIV